LEIVRKNVAKYIEKRDGVGQCSHDDVILCAGASEGIRVSILL
jgi:aspartate/methionine/tyrosine aminotransferase